MHQLEQINKLTDKVLQELKSIGIPVSNNIEKVVINTRTKKRLGACKKNVNSCGRESFIIEISARALACKEEQICIPVPDVSTMAKNGKNTEKKQRRF